jgi:hypothetical protein
MWQPKQFPPKRLTTEKPIEGVSMAYTWDKADAPDQRVTQYFEMFGTRYWHLADISPTAEHVRLWG